MNERCWELWELSAGSIAVGKADGGGWRRTVAMPRVIVPTNLHIETVCAAMVGVGVIDRGKSQPERSGEDLGALEACCW